MVRSLRDRTTTEPVLASWEPYQNTPDTTGAPPPNPGQFLAPDLTATRPDFSPPAAEPDLNRDRPAPSGQTEPTPKPAAHGTTSGNPADLTANFTPGRDTGPDDLLPGFGER